MTATTRIQLRRGVAADWTSANPTLASGEFGFETDTLKFKVGDGATAWASLAYESGLSPNASKGSPNTITALGGVGVLGRQREVQFVVGSGGAVTVTKNPQVSAGTVVGQELVLFGTSDANTVTLSNGTGLALNGACTLRAQASLYLVWDGTTWTEVSRNDN